MKKLFITILTVSILFATKAQTSVSFYHLRNTTFQNSYLNPAWVPEGNFFLGLPGLSGVHLNVNSKVSYNNIFTKENNTVTLDLDKVISNLQKQNMISTHVNVNLFHVGYKFNAGATLSLFANERVEMDYLMPKRIFNYILNEDDLFINDELRFGQIGIRAQHFREIGFGYAYQPNSKLSFGIKGKYLQGFGDVSTPFDLKARITTEGESFAFKTELKNATLRTSGVDIYSGNEGDLGTHLVSNSNKGFGVDLGIDYKLSKYYSVAFSVLDLGYINWKENVSNYGVADTTFTYNGVNLDGLSDIRKALEDSLFNRFKPIENSDPYKTWLPIKIYSSWTYHYSDQLSFSATLGSRLVQRHLKMLYGGAVTYKLGRALTVSGSAVKLPQQFFNLGASLAVRGGPVQLYMAADQIVNFSVPDAKALDFRIGMNFIFGGWNRSPSKSSGGGYASPFASQKISTTKAKGVSTGAFLGSEVKTKRREGIYSIIKRQKRRQVDTRPSKRDKGVNSKPLPKKRFEE
jgi:hypothetical protein